MKTFYRKLKDLSEVYQPKRVGKGKRASWFVDGYCGYCVTSGYYKTREEACKQAYKYLVLSKKEKQGAI